MFNSYQTTTLELNTELCNGCGLCTSVCPHAVFEIVNRRAVIVNGPSCMECGACMVNCQQNAIHVESGVGCATAMMIAALTGSRKVSCGCS